MAEESAIMSYLKRAAEEKPDFREEGLVLQALEPKAPQKKKPRN